VLEVCGHGGAIGLQKLRVALLHQEQPLNPLWTDAKTQEKTRIVTNGENPPTASLRMPRERNIAVKEPQWIRAWSRPVGTTHKGAHPVHQARKI
jgi:hypothetical protein